MRIRSLPLIVASVAVCLFPGDVAAQESRPNVILFLVDDLGWQDTEVPFHTEVTPFNRRYRTPAMKRLAAAGMVFTDAYAASPVCTPTRVSIMTGRNPARHRTTNWILRKDKGPNGRHATLRPPAWRCNGIGADDVTLARLLQGAGYRTIHVGKAHLGAIGTSGADPRALGFDVNVAGHAAGGPGSYYGRHHFKAGGRRGDLTKKTVWDIPGLDAWHGKDVHLTEVLTREAVKAVEGAVGAKKPFFLHMSHYAVHAPIMPTIAS